MKERIESLLEKYWEGETSLAEEQELKSLLKSQSDFEKEKGFFGLMESYGQENPENLTMPKAKVRKINSQWLSWAASVAIFTASFVGWRVYEKNQEERQAYEEVMQAFALIQTNLAKGQEQMQVMNDMKYLNTTNQMFGTIKK
ncbi:hypothetical protein FHS59_001744 [Algoriphagus iocasae]|jgi:hypothetical protein|uniref:Uncharacterized protein n=1 Tax=Algoriphagus iocasae TaxID=1836499 RepID=A0A841MPK1_9BACT|nr:hypothetical protein [Algoriphagus iocasae]MBB6326116.1 hypothetical protein [Algoriphagus iocasae]